MARFISFETLLPLPEDRYHLLNRTHHDDPPFGLHPEPEIKLSPLSRHFLASKIKRILPPPQPLLIVFCMKTSMLSPKFQIVIPKEIRKTLNLKPGQRIQFAEKDGRVEIRPVLTADQLIGFLKGEKPLLPEREPDRQF